MGHQSKLGSYGKNWIIGLKTEISPPPQKKRSLLDSNNDLKKFWMLFGIKPIFGQKKTFRLNVKTTVSPFGPDRIRRHSWSFCDGPHISTKFCWNSPRIRVLILVIGEWPETTKKRGEPWKMTHTLETDFLGGPNGKLLPQAYWWYALFTKIAISIQKIDFLPKISKSLGQILTFSSHAANLSHTRQCCQHGKGVS